MNCLSLRPLVLVAILASVLLLPATGCRQSNSEPGTPRLAYVTNGTVSFWQVAAAGARQAGEDLGVEVTVVMPSDLNDQTRKIEDLLTRGTDGVAVSPISSDNQNDLLNKVAAATNLITHDSDAPDCNRLAYIGMDNYEAGLMCGKMARDAIPDGGTLMIFVGRLDQDNATHRRQGCIDAFLGREPDRSRRDPPGVSPTSDDEKYQILGTKLDGMEPARAMANVEDTLTRHPDVSAMVGLFAYNPPAILEALDRAGKLNQVKVIGFDEDDVTLQAIIDGTCVGTIVQDPYKYGYESIRMLAALHAGDKSALPESRYIDVPPRLIDKENVEEFWATLKEQMGK